MEKLTGFIGFILFLVFTAGCNKKQIGDCHRAFQGYMLQVNSPDTVLGQDSVWIDFEFLPKDGCGGYDRLTIDYSLDTIFVAPVTSYTICGCSLPADTIQAQDWLPLPFDSVNVFLFQSLDGTFSHRIIKQ